MASDTLTHSERQRKILKAVEHLELAMLDLRAVGLDDKALAVLDLIEEVSSAYIERLSGGAKK